jgi:D-Tyr-tRNAtyr deacylase
MATSPVADGRPSWPRRRPTDTGEFGAMMDVALVNDGPVTLVMDR